MPNQLQCHNTGDILKYWRAPLCSCFVESSLFDNQGHCAILHVTIYQWSKSNEHRYTKLQYFQRTVNLSLLNISKRKLIWCDISFVIQLKDTYSFLCSLQYSHKHHGIILIYINTFLMLQIVPSFSSNSCNFMYIATEIIPFSICS